MKKKYFAWGFNILWITSFSIQLWMLENDIKGTRIVLIATLVIILLLVALYLYYKKRNSLTE